MLVVMVTPENVEAVSLEKLVDEVIGEFVDGGWVDEFKLELDEINVEFGVQDGIDVDIRAAPEDDAELPVPDAAVVLANALIPVASPASSGMIVLENCPTSRPACRR